MLKRKLIKLTRQFRWSIQALGGVPLHWHIGRPNFGDDLNPLLFSRLLGSSVHLCRKQYRERILGMGSILHKADANCTVVGSGLLNPDAGTSVQVKSVLSLRGYLSAEATDLSPPFFGDPAIFLPKLVPMSTVKNYRFGFVPHHSENDRMRSLIPEDWLFIDPAWSPLKVLASICSCECLLSRSLHGLICADAYGVRNAWIAPVDGMEGGAFKFLDYYTTTNKSKSPAQIAEQDLKREGESLEYFVSEYCFSKQEYADSLRQACLALS